MKKLTPFLLLCLMALLFAGCANQASETTEDGQIVAPSGFVCPEPEYDLEVTSTELNIFVWTEYIPDDIIDCFQLVYGVTINRDEYSSNEEMYAKLNAGGSNYDIAQPTDYWVPLMIRQGLLQPLDHAKLPVLASFDPTYLNLSFDPNNEYSIPYQAGTYGIVVNTEAVENIPQSWADLWKPEYAGRMIFLDDNRATIGLTLLTLGYDLNSTDPAQLEEAKAKLLELVPGIKIFDSDSPKTALIAGDVDLGMTWTGEAYLAARENPAFVYIYPTEGTIRWQDNYVLLKDAPHLDAAYAWLNYSMQGSIFWKMLADFPYTMPSKGALEYAQANQPELYEAYINSPITNTPPEVYENAHYFVDVGEATPLYDQIWVEVKGE
ncbi:MAG: spermidine/putrescine ABC transporter substrate-binding protein [Anaerolineales bacterium]